MNSARLLLTLLAEEKLLFAHNLLTQLDYTSMSIKMRQKAILPNEVADRYPENETMQNKALLQELINNNFNKILYKNST